MDSAASPSSTSSTTSGSAERLAAHAAEIHDALEVVLVHHDAGTQACPRGIFFRHLLMRLIRLPSIPAATILALLAASSPLAAQGGPPAARDSAPDVPREMLPPPGKCRIWIAGVPAKQQPAATDCATALRQNPSNGTVLYGPRPKDDEAVDFESPNRPTSDPRSAMLKRMSLTERRDVDARDTVRQSRNAPTDSRVPASKDAPPPKPEPAKKPVDPPTKKPVDPPTNKPERP